MPGKVTKASRKKKTRGNSDNNEDHGKENSGDQAEDVKKVKRRKVLIRFLVGGHTLPVCLFILNSFVICSMQKSYV